MGGSLLFIFPASGFMINLALKWVIPTAAFVHYLGDSIFRGLRWVVSTTQKKQ
jgi:hypothetical protein